MSLGLAWRWGRAPAVGAGADVRRLGGEGRRGRGLLLLVQGESREEPDRLDFHARFAEESLVYGDLVDQGLIGASRADPIISLGG